MSLAFPLSPPTSRGPRRVTIEALSAVGISESPFTFEQQAYVHQGERWGLEFELGSMNRDEGEEWAAFITSLNGREGTFLMGDPLGAAPRGTWAGAPKVLGAHAAGVKSIAMDGFSVGATVKAGDWFQRGSGASTHLYKVMQDATADGSGLLTLELWPRLRVALVDNDTFTTSSAKGIWRLTDNSRRWTLDDVRIGGIVVGAAEVL